MKPWSVLAAEPPSQAPLALEEGACAYLCLSENLKVKHDILGSREIFLNPIL